MARCFVDVVDHLGKLTIGICAREFPTWPFRFPVFPLKISEDFKNVWNVYHTFIVRPLTTKHGRKTVSIEYSLSPLSRAYRRSPYKGTCAKYPGHNPIFVGGG